MAKALHDRLQDGIVLLDSAMGTMLQNAGLKSGHESGELWNVDPVNCAHVRDIHRANVAAGSDILITNTFGANRLKLAHYGAADKLEKINIAAARLAREAAGESALVAGDIGPTGDILEQWGGTRSAAEMLEVFQQQAAALSEGGVDLITLETFMDIEEIKLALEAVRKVSRLPVLASMSFQAGPGGLRTMWGLTPAEVSAQLEAAGADIVGSNCGITIDSMAEVVRGMVEGSNLPVAAQPNAGAPAIVDGRTVYQQTAEQMAGGAMALIEAGARLVGGCCGSTPGYIAAVKKNLARV